MVRYLLLIIVALTTQWSFAASNNASKAKSPYQLYQDYMKNKQSFDSIESDEDANFQETVQVNKPAPRQSLNALYNKKGRVSTIKQSKPTVKVSGSSEDKVLVNSIANVQTAEGGDVLSDYGMFARLDRGYYDQAYIKYLTNQIMAFKSDEVDNLFNKNQCVALSRTSVQSSLCCNNATTKDLALKLRNSTCYYAVGALKIAKFEFITASGRVAKVQQIVQKSNTDNYDKNNNGEDPNKPDPSKPEPELVKPDPFKPEPVKPEPVKPEPEPEKIPMYNRPAGLSETGGA